MVPFRWDAFHWQLWTGAFVKNVRGAGQDGNKIESKNIVIDGVITKGKWEFRTFEGIIDIIDGLPDGVIQAGISPVAKYDNGVYKLSGCAFLDSQRLLRAYNGEKMENRSCNGIIWIKDGEIVMEFYQIEDDTDGYYIYYSDIKMLDIEEVKERVNRNI